MDAKEKKLVDRSFRTMRFQVFFFPFMILCFHDVHFQAYAQLFMGDVFSNAEQLKRYTNYGESGSFSTYLIIALYVATFLWYRPFGKLHGLFKKDQLSSELSRKCGKRFQSLIQTLTILFLTILVCKIAYRLVLPSGSLSTQEILYYALPAHIFGMAAELTFALTYTQQMKFGFTKVFQAIYPGEEIFRAKSGSRLTTVSLVRFFFLFNLILPMATLLIVRIYNDSKELEFFFTNVMGSGMFQMLCMSIVGMFLLNMGLDRPIQELISKMKEVEEGNLDVRTTVMFNDEVSSLKVQFNKMVEGIRKQEELKELFGRYMSSSVALKLIEEGQIKLGGDKIQAAVMFSDIRGFTTLSESMSPEEVVQFLNRYFQYITKPILENGGMINKYIGDCVMVVFAPIFDCEDFADKALLAAKGMREELLRV